MKTAVDSDREVKPVEQHIHSFLEALPFGHRDAWRLVPRQRPLSPGYRSLPEQGKSFPGKDVEPSCVSRF
ncbi:hypothetical protein [Streptomyces canus]|uniref:hypothetical protein n=1 Tax=Streptomyces canus TaxID=58343 RepID=UPI0030E4B2EA